MKYCKKSFVLATLFLVSFGPNAFADMFTGDTGECCESEYWGNTYCGPTTTTFTTSAYGKAVSIDTCNFIENATCINVRRTNDGCNCGIWCRSGDCGTSQHMIYGPGGSCIAGGDGAEGCEARPGVPNGTKCVYAPWENPFCGAYNSRKGIQCENEGPLPDPVTTICTAGVTEYQGCGNNDCGTQSRTCVQSYNGFYIWGPWSSCEMITSLSWQEMNTLGLNNAGIINNPVGGGGAINGGTVSSFGN